MQFSLLPYLDTLLKTYQTDYQQPDNLCGPYWVSLLLKAYGDVAVTAVDVAIAASTLLPSHGNPTDWLPPNATSLHGPNYDQIPTHPDPAICGTAIQGLIHATQKLSQGEFCLLPLQASDWQIGLSTILTLCQTHPVWQAIPLLNPHTSYFWGTSPSPLTLVSYLQSHPISPPPTDWSVGHFNLLIGDIQQGSKTLYALLDTYPQLGWQGWHLQPPDTLSQSLHRPQQATQGGLALFIRKTVRSDVERMLSKQGFSMTVWDNGSPIGTLGRPTPEGRDTDC